MTSPPPDASDRTPISIPAGTLRGWADLLAKGWGRVNPDTAADSVARAIRAVLDEQTGEQG